MLIRAANAAEDAAGVAYGDALGDGSFHEVWKRYARTTALALRSDAAFAVLRTAESWSIVGAHGKAAGIHPRRLLDEIRIGIPTDPALERTSVDPGIGVCPTSPEWGDSLLLCAHSSAPRRWSRREWQVLDALGDSLRNELRLRLHRDPLADEIADGDGPDAGVARLTLSADLNDGVHETLRRSILAAVHEGTAQTGDRLPSIREVADACDTTTYSVIQAYSALENEGIVEKRERSGIFIASLGESPVRRLPETATWLRGVVAEGYLLQVKLPGLPDLIQRWTGSSPLRVACIESSEDYRVALCEEIRGQFGLEALDIPIVDDAPLRPTSPPDSLESAVRRADLIVTTPFHLARVRGLAARLGIPLLVATLDDASATVLPRRLRGAEEVVLVCVDHQFGHRMMINLDADQRQRVRIAVAGAAGGVPEIDRSKPVLITKAARQRLAGEDFRLVLPQYPAFSRRFAERLAHTIIQLNLEGMRRTSRS